MKLSPTQEHYLKRQLLQWELYNEMLQFNEIDGLESFGPPFSSATTHRFPIVEHFMRTIVMEFPLLKGREFIWDDVRQLYERVLSLNFSESIDREEATKRKKLGGKLGKLVLLLYNSGVAAAQDQVYYTEDKFKSEKVAMKPRPNSELLAEYLADENINGLEINVVGVRMVVEKKLFKSNYHQFIIRHRRRGEYIYVARRYHEFQKLHQDLRAEFPGKKLAKLPDKIKASWSLIGDDETQDDQEEDEKLPREKMRTALRYYLRELIRNREVAASVAVMKFISLSAMVPSKSDLADIEQRRKVDEIALANHLKFQQQAFAKKMEIQERIKPFRNKLLVEDSFIATAFQEFKTCENVSQLSPLLQTFIEWAQIQISATLYQSFLGSDSSYEFYSQVKRIHKVFPYRVVCQILKVTNPVAIMKSLVELLLKTTPFNGPSLLQMMFSGMLNDDIKNQEKACREIEDRLDDQEIIARLRYYVFECDPKLAEQIRELSGKLDLALSIIVTPMIPLPTSALEADLIESYAIEEEAGLASMVKDLLHLYIRQNDKEMMKRLWAEPELVGLLRDFLSVFYEPLIKVFKDAHIDVFVRSFQLFMDDVIKTIDKLHGTSSTSEIIVEELNNVVKRHEQAFYSFIHDVYIHDKAGLFEGLLNWMTNLLHFMGNSKRGTGLKIDLSQLLDKFDNPQGVVNEIDAIIAQIREQRQEQKPQEDTGDVLQKQWKHVNEFDILDSSQLGVSEGDIVDLEADTTVKDEEIQRFTGLFKTCITELLYSS